jgi:hypothetical protein
VFSPTQHLGALGASPPHTPLATLPKGAGLVIISYLSRSEPSMNGYYLARLNNTDPTNYNDPVSVAKLPFAPAAQSGKHDSEVTRFSALLAARRIWDASSDLLGGGAKLLQPYSAAELADFMGPAPTPRQPAQGSGVSAGGYGKLPLLIGGILALAGVGYVIWKKTR